jgi:hypothetical protein
MQLDNTTKLYEHYLLDNINSKNDIILLTDHIGGFEQNLDNYYLNLIPDNIHTVYTEYLIDDRLIKKYPNLNLKFSLTHFLEGNYFEEFKTFERLVATRFRGTNNTFGNFVCSFNGSMHVSRVLLVSALSKFNFFNEGYCSKNFTYTEEYLGGIIDNNRFQSLFFDRTIGHKILSFQYNRFDHKLNYYVLTPKILNSFLHIVSESLATSAYPFITEKFLYSVVNHGLFLAYAQPGWHEYLEKYLGFKKYDKIFDYSFDSIQDPINRLITLLTMISKFANMSNEEWNLLYHLERETLAYNFNHYNNGKYIQALKDTNQI